MSETTNDQPYDLRAELALARRESLVERLRGWCPHHDEYPRVLIEEAADEIRQLRAELAAAIKQRDEARRLVCWHTKKLYRTLKETAAERGWDCYVEGGGA